MQQQLTHRPPPSPEQVIPALSDPSSALRNAGYSQQLVNRQNKHEALLKKKIKNQEQRVARMRGIEDE